MIRILEAPSAAPVLFPHPKITKFVDYLRSVWEELKALSPPWWQKLETTLVDAFYKELKNDERILKAGVGYGHLVLEASEIELVGNMPKRSGRTDIKLLYAVAMGPELVFEFKRLNNGTALRRQYVHSGMKRFSTGQYSRESDFGIMVGMVSGDPVAEKAAMIRYIKRAASVTALSLSACTDPSIDGCFDFDTDHDRPTTCLTRTIRLGHVFLER